jgi:hypothetical protein
LLHTQEVAGSNPAPPTIDTQETPSLTKRLGLLLSSMVRGFTRRTKLLVSSLPTSAASSAGRFLVPPLVRDRAQLNVLTREL